MNSTNLDKLNYENVSFLAPIKVKILFIFPLKIKRLQRKAGKWIADKSRAIRSLIKEC